MLRRTIPLLQKAARDSLYITTPIFYPNAAPHLGHQYSMLLCDVRNRWAKFTGMDTFFTTGTDEHGLKIQNAAESKGIPPKQFVDALSVVFKDLAQKSGIQCDRFIRTTDADHSTSVEYFWNVLREGGWIYEGEHEGWYSVSDETFYPETQIHNIDEKWCSIETGNEVKLTSEMNYFFKLSAFQGKLIDHLEQNPGWITPRQKHLELLAELKSAPLADLSISRPSTRLTWGIPVPSDDSQRIYVWIDALVNYLTSVEYPNTNHYWPATHLIGKDIIRFHCIYWPALLMATGTALPERVVVHGHWLCEGSKMSKSRGNVVDPIKIIDTYGKDAVRFFLCENSVLNGDNNFSETALARSRDQIVDKFANLVMRCCGKKFDITKSLTLIDAAKNYQFEDPIIQEQFVNIQRGIDALSQKMNDQMVEYNTAGAIQHWWSLISETNQFIQDSAPWSRPIHERDLIILVGCEVARVSAILIQPIMPDLSARMLQRLNVVDNSMGRGSFGSDTAYGEGANRAGDYPITKLQSK